MQYLVQMQTPEHKQGIEEQIEQERLRQRDLNAEVERLEKQIKHLQEDSTVQLKSRLKEVRLGNCRFILIRFVLNCFELLSTEHEV